MDGANYNSLFRMTGLKRHLWGTIFALLVATATFASNWTAPATDLSKSISGVTGPGSVTLAIVNSSSLTKSDVSEIQHTIEAQLRAAGVRVGTAVNASSDVRITLSENLQGYLWVAEIKQGNETQVTMAYVPRTEAAAIPPSGPSVTIRKTLLWSQPGQILDAYVDHNRLVLLDAATVSTFALNSGRWQLDHTLAIAHQHNFPRDLRGLLVPAKDHLADAYLPGTVCNVTADTSFAVACHDGDDPWPLGTLSALFNSARDYFTGALFPASAKSVAPFYTMVKLERRNSTLSVFTGIDGRVRTNDGINDYSLPATEISDWGSDMAALKSECGSGAQLLVTGAGDDTTGDSLRAYEIPYREPVLVSAAADFSGPITALWTHGDSATAVAHNLRTGSYDAYSVSVTCSE